MLNGIDEARRLSAMGSYD